MNGANPFLRLALVAALALVACADDASLQREFAKLSSDDPAVRDAATDAIVQEGKDARKAVAARMAVESDPELRGRLAEVLERIEVKALRELNWEPVWTSEPFESPATASAVSPDGKRLATGGDDGRVRVMDAATLEVVREVETGIRIVRWGVAFSPDGTTVIVFNAFGTPVVKAWRIADGTEIRGFVRAEFEGFQVWVEPGGIAALLTQPGRSGEGQILAVLDGHRFDVLLMSHYIRASADRTRIALVPQEKGREIVRVYAGGEGTPVAETSLELETRDQAVERFDLDAQLATAAVVKNGVCREFDLNTGKRTHEFGKGLFGVRAVPGGWVTWTRKGLLQWWKDGVESKRIRGRPLRKCFAHVVAGLLVLNTLSPDPGDDFPRGVVLRSAETGKLVEWHPRAKMSGPWSGGAFVLQLGDSTVRLYAGGKFVRELPQGPERPQDWSRTEQEGPTLVVSESAPVLLRLDADTPPTPLPPHHASVEALRWMPDGLTASDGRADVIFAADGSVARRVAEGFLQGTRDNVDPALLGHLPGGPRWATPDGSVSAWVENHAVQVRRGDTTDTFPMSDDDAAASDQPLLALSGDGKRLAVFGPARTGLDIWDLEARKLLVRGPLAGDNIRKLLFAADGQTLAVVDDDMETIPTRNLRILNADGRQVARLDWAGKQIAGDWVLGGRWVAGVVDGDFRVADLLHPEKTQSWSVSNRNEQLIEPLVASPDGKYLLVLVKCELSVWRLDISNGSQQLLGEFPAPGGGAVLLAGGHAAVLLSDGLMILRAGSWEPADLRPDLRGTWIDASPDGKRLALTRNSRVTLYEPR